MFTNLFKLPFIVAIALKFPSRSYMYSLKFLPTPNTSKDFWDPTVSLSV